MEQNFPVLVQKKLKIDMSMNLAQGETEVKKYHWYWEQEIIEGRRSTSMGIYHTIVAVRKRCSLHVMRL